MICQDRLPSLADVRTHLRAYRDDLSRCVLAFSGGKESVAMARLVREVNESVPLVYLSCPGCEWPSHEAFVRSFQPIIMDSGHGWNWLRANPWAFLFSDAKSAERWYRVHQRGILRNFAKETGRILLWGNRLADRNTVPAVRYAPDSGPELWMPLRDLSYDDILGVCGNDGLTPMYNLKSTWKSGYVTDFVHDPGSRFADAKSELALSDFESFRMLYESKFPHLYSGEYHG